jgi:hypothetical protein
MRENGAPTITGVSVKTHALHADLSDGRSIIVPISWFPRLAEATAQERANWRLIAGGRGVHWPDLDEDISATNLLQGQPSNESQSSFQKWLAARHTRPAAHRRRSSSAH